MTEHLLEEPIAKIFDNGYSTLSLENSSRNRREQISNIDFEEILESEKPKKIIRSLPSLDVYRALKEKGVEDCLSILPLLSDEQVIKIFDFDVWQNDRLSPKQAFKWLKLFGDVSTKQLYKRFSNLDEEYQLAIVGPFIKFYDLDEYEKLTEAHQDRLVALPSQEAYYEVVSDDPEIHLGIEYLIESLMAHNMAYTISLLAHAAYMPPSEQEADAARFRKARIEEDGFVTFEESQTAFLKIDFKTLKNKYKTQKFNPSENISTFTRSKKYFIEQVIDYSKILNLNSEQTKVIQQGIVFLANNLCTASQIETDDLHGLRIVLRHAKAITSLGLEFLSDGNLELACQILLELYPKKVFQVGFNVISELRDSFIESLPIIEKDYVQNSLRNCKFGKAQDYIDRNWLEKLGFEFTEVLKGLCNRFPVIPTSIDSNNLKVTFVPIGSMSQLDDLSEKLQNLSGSLFAHESKSTFIDIDNQ